MKNLIYIFLLFMTGAGFAGDNVILVKLQNSPGNLYKKNVNRTGFSRVDQILNTYDVRKVKPVFENFSDVHEFKELNVWVKCEFPGDSDGQAIIEKFRDLPEVVAAQPNHTFKLHYIPNDPRVNEQYALSKVDAFAAWDVERGSADIPVAVIDTGVDYEHADLAGNMWLNSGEDINGNGLVDPEDFNGIDDDANGFTDDIRGWDFTDAPNYPDGGDYLDRDNDPMDERGHGTGVAGIIAAVTDNQTGIAGLASGCRIMNLRAFTTGGNGEEDDVASAILYAVHNGARVINMSWGDVFVTRLLDDVIRYAASRDVVMVASAGNSSTDRIHYPSEFEGTISVGATDENDNLAGFSNYGPGIDLVAPGVNILTTDLENKYSPMSGTSFSAPYVSAATALLLSREADLSAGVVKGLIKGAVDDLGEKGIDSYYGAGRLNVYKLLSAPVHTIVRITLPLLDQGIGGTSLDIYGSAWSPALESYSLTYGAGDNPDTWIEIGSQDNLRVIDGLLGTWDTLPAEEGAYTIRLRIENRDGTSSADFVRVFLDNTPPEISSVEFLPMITGDRHAVLIRFETDDLCEGSVFYRPAGSQKKFQEAVLAFRTNELRYVLTQQEAEGLLDIKLQAKNGSGLVTEDDNDGNFYRVNLSGAPLNVTNFSPVSMSMPAGYLLNKTFDYNNNGLPELILSEEQNNAIGNIGLYEFDGSAMSQVFSTDRNIIPRDLLDTDGDGIPELLCGFGFSSYLLKSPSAGMFPSDLVKTWEGDGNNQYWASRLADLDRDGSYEVIMRVVNSGTSEDTDRFEVWEDNGTGNFAFTAAFPNPTGGENINGVPHCEIADFDGDGRTEILLGDSDGDLYIYENTGNNTFQNTWQDSLPLLDSIDFINAGDFDGDGNPEFFAGCHSDPNLNTEHYYDARHWLYRIYDADGDNHFESRAEWIFFGYESTKDFPSGVSSGDIDKDGSDEIVLTVFPDLYVLDYTNQNEYEIKYYYKTAMSNAAVITDADNNGKNEFWIGNNDLTMSFEGTGSGTGPATPVGLSAVPLDESRVFLSWREVEGADMYHIFRGTDKLLLTPYVISSSAFYLDKNVVSGAGYWYAVEAVDHEKTPQTGGRSEIIFARPGARPYLQKAVMESPAAVRLYFSEPLNQSAKNVSNYLLDHDIGRPTSAAVDASGSQALLTLGAVFPEEGLYEVSCFDLADLDNTPLDTIKNKAEFYVEFAPSVPYLVDGLLKGRNSLELIFSEALSETSIQNTGNYDLGENISVRSAGFVSGSRERVLLELDTDKVFGALGNSYYVKVKNVESQSGVAIQPGRGDYLQLIFSKNDLSQVMTFPNPYHPGFGEEKITFANLTKTAEIRIMTEMGLPVRTISEMNGDGGVDWDLRDKDGNPVASGIYIYQVTNGEERVFGKLAIIR
ncbi:S8 family serine peptidase [candidate division KSB1 bacterium]|nr:S8 family serine peptidase [candidate division KSB1 bacterium]